MANFSLGEAVLGTGIDLKGIQDGLNEAKDAAQTGVDKIAGVMKTGLKVAAGAALAGALALGAGFSFAFGEAMEGEKNLVRLEQVIQSTGGAAGLTSEEAQDLANQFKNLAGGSDDVILGLEEIGLRAGTISEEQMPAFIQSSLDLGAVMGDNASAAELLARAQEDPVAALGKLTKAGIIFTGEQEEQIKKMAEAGDNAGALEIIMGRLAEATGGAAAANAGTLAGQWEIFKGTLGEAAEIIGGAFLPVAHELFDSVIAPAIPIVEGLAGQLASNIPGAIEAAKSQFTAFLPTIQPIVGAAQNVAAAFTESMPMVQAEVGKMTAFVKDQFDRLSPTLIANVTTTLNNIAEFWREHGDEIMAVVGFAFRFIFGTIGGTLTLITGIVAAATALLNGNWRGAGEILKNTTKTFMNGILGIVGTDLNSFTATWRNNFEMAKLIVTTVFNNIVGFIQGKLGEFTGFGRAIIQGLIDGMNAMLGALIGAATGAIGAVLNAIKALLGIASPSKVMFDMGVNTGMPFAEGMAESILNGLPRISQAAMAAAGTAVSSSQTFNIDARGSTLGADAIEMAVRRVLAEAGRTADGRMRMGTV